MDTDDITTERCYETVFQNQGYCSDPKSGTEDDPLSDSENDTIDMHHFVHVKDVHTD